MKREPPDLHLHPSFPGILHSEKAEHKALLREILRIGARDQVAGEAAFACYLSEFEISCDAEWFEYYLQKYRIALNEYVSQRPRF